MADWRVLEIRVDAYPFGVAAVGRETSITWGLVGNQQWRAVERQAQGLTPPDYLMVQFFPTGSREAAVQAQAEPDGPWRYTLKVTLAEEGVWRMMPRAVVVVKEVETRWPNKGASLLVQESLPQPPQQEAELPVSGGAASMASEKFLPGWLPSVLWASLGGGLVLFLVYRLMQRRGLEG